MSKAVTARDTCKQDCVECELNDMLKPVYGDTIIPIELSTSAFTAQGFFSRMASSIYLMMLLSLVVCTIMLTIYTILEPPRPKDIRNQLDFRQQ